MLAVACGLRQLLGGTRGEIDSPACPQSVSSWFALDRDDPDGAVGPANTIATGVLLSKAFPIEVHPRISAPREYTHPEALSEPSEPPVDITPPFQRLPRTPHRTTRLIPSRSISTWKLQISPARSPESLRSA